jgi:methionine salvage enolase-phosphatase E1
MSGGRRTLRSRDKKQQKENILTKKTNRKQKSEKRIEKGGIQCLLLDIEGTTTPISFVHDVLFPYARKNVKSFLDSHWDDVELNAKVTALVQQVILAIYQVKK